MTRDDIDNYFKLKELRYIKDAENIWHVRFRSKIANFQRFFEVFVILLDDWIYLRVPLFLADNQTCWPHLVEYLLGLNYTFFLTKVALQGRQILFTTELSSHCSMADLDEAVMAADTYINAYYLAIETMATCPQIASLVHTILWGTQEDTSTAEQEDIPWGILSN